MSALQVVVVMLAASLLACAAVLACLARRFSRLAEAFGRLAEGFERDAGRRTEAADTPPPAARRHMS